MMNRFKHPFDLKTGCWNQTEAPNTSWIRVFEAIFGVTCVSLQSYGRDMPDMDVPTQHPLDALWDSRASEVDDMLAQGQATGRW